MRALLPLLEPVIVQTLLNNRRARATNSKLGLGLMALSGLLFCTAFIFAVLSSYQWLASIYPPAEASLYLCGGLLGIGVVGTLVSALALRPKVPVHDVAEETTETIEQILLVLGDELAEPVKENPKTALFLAGLAGFFANEHVH